MKLSIRPIGWVRSLRVVLLVGSQLLMGGCAWLGPSNNDVFTRIDVKDVQEDNSIPLLAQGDAVSTGASSSELVRWGGTIASVQNLPDNITRLEIVARPLQRSGRPIRDDRSSGRFIAQVPEFLDPEIVEVGRDVTVTGALLARENGLIGETEYVFPIVQTNDYTVWKAQVTGRESELRYLHRPSRRYFDRFQRRWIRY